MSTFRALAYMMLGATLTGCAEKAHWVPPDRSCPGALRPVWVADSSLTICVVTSFRTHDLRTWRREAVPSGEDVFTITTNLDTAQAVLTGGWPPTLVPHGDCNGDCAHADSAEVHPDTVAGAPARTEVGIVTSGVAGGQRVWALVASWPMGGNRLGMATAQSASRATLDTMLLMLHSAHTWSRR